MSASNRLKPAFLALIAADLYSCPPTFFPFPALARHAARRLRVATSSTFWRLVFKVEAQSDMAGGDIKIKRWSR
jgi:hypothetical protein